ncbi:hypothetical protein [Microbulbifer pacificus]|uniref:hypothetical protein n=1 Tax=Microbulbifer pacificus TaxID=407164 RepID=UPI001319C640|nr:hypothetical protein [Microbulbifer pacificus]
MKEKYRKVELQGKHGMIDLMIPDRDPTQEEIQELHDTVAKVLVNTIKHKDREKRKASSE